MTQYCRYCNNFVCGNGEWCQVKQTELTEKYSKNPNRCKEFEFNPIDAYGENKKGYHQRVQCTAILNGQIRMDI